MGTDQTEYQSAKSNGAVLDLENRALVEVSGKDAVPFLHRMLTNDIKNLKPGSGCYACLLNPQAKIIADMNVFVDAGKAWLAMEISITEKVIGVLEKFTVTDDVTFLDKSKELSILAVMGTQAENAVKALAGGSYPNEVFSHAPLKTEDFDGRLFCISLFGFKTWCFVVPSRLKSEALERIKAAAKPFGISQISKATAQTLRIESGTPRYGADLSEEVILPEVKLIESKAVSFTKGCYPGQEIVARIDSRGKFAKQLAGIALSGEKIPNPGDKIKSAEKEAGRITSACFSPALAKPLALGFLASGYLEIGTQVEVLINDTPEQAEIIKLPV